MASYGPDYIAIKQKKFNESYLDVIERAFAIHIDRESVRGPLWKDYPAEDQMFQIMVKQDRVKRTIDLAPLTLSEKVVDETVGELLDIINYAYFAIRKLEGTA